MDTAGATAVAEVVAVVLATAIPLVRTGAVVVGIGARSTAAVLASSLKRRWVPLVRGMLHTSSRSIGIARRLSHVRGPVRYDDAHHDPYKESYDPEPYPVFPQITPYARHPETNYYPSGNYFLPPPPQPYSYGSAGPTLESYALRPRRADENVSAP
ncbi:hypothetical protein BDV11DRAFT_175328 [Aspergillus similis]